MLGRFLMWLDRQFSRLAHKLCCVRISWRAVGATAAALTLLFAIGLISINRQTAEADTQVMLAWDELYRLNREKEKLQSELDKVGTSAYVEQVARSDEGYLREGEIRFTFTNPEALSWYTTEEAQIINDDTALQDALINTEKLLLTGQ